MSGRFQRLPIYAAILLEIVLLTSAATYNYNEVLKKSILFYEAQRSGKLPSTNRIPWRGDSALTDKGNDGEDLTGGWYDGGDHVKFGFPMASAVTTLIWGGLEFKAGYQAAGEWNNFLDSVRWPLNYFMKCHVSTNNFYGQVGDANVDHEIWGRPEDMTMDRPAYKLTTTAPGSDLAGETAAALAAGHLLFKDSDNTFATRLLDHARRLYDFAYNYKGLYHESITNAEAFYTSTSYEDELAWGAAWLYKATGESQYLSRALEFADDSEESTAIYDWDSKFVGYQLLLFSLGQNQFRAYVEKLIDYWINGERYTEKGLVWMNDKGPNRNAANSAFIAMVAAKHGILPTKGVKFARSQIKYILGDAGRSFVVGFGSTPPLRARHRAASCKNDPADPCDWKDFDLSTPNPHVLNGALVEGPDQSDYYEDNRKTHFNEVRCDYNSGFQGAVAGLKERPLEDIVAGLPILG